MFNMFLLCFALVNVYGKGYLKEAKSAILNGSLKTIQQLYKDHKIDWNTAFNSKGYNLLMYAIELRKNKIVDFMLKSGADPNLVTNGNVSPLIMASKIGNRNIIKILINHRANVNHRADNGKTALIYACRAGYYTTARILLENGADPFLADKHYKTAYDYAVKNVRESTVRFLESKFSTIYVPGYLDGPYIFWETDSIIRTEYLLRDSVRNYSRKIIGLTNIEKDYVSYKDNLATNFTLKIFKGDNEPSSWKYLNVDSVLVIGDIHGAYHELIEFLRSNNIINEKLEWSWGNGHVVFMGDLVDKGQFVTETLWFIYKLEKEAEHSGGRVHTILGNHEIMAMLGDYRYLSEKYEFLFSSLNKDYASYLGKNTVLGRWLRKKHTIMTINNIIFSHAGISSEFKNYGYSIDTINHIVRNILLKPLDAAFTSKENIITGEKGPLWFRGYFNGGIAVNSFIHPGLDSTLLYYNVEKMVVGHTEVPYVLPMFKNKLIAVDVPFDRKGFEPQALLISNKQLFRLFGNKRREKIK